jgi:hypothetical protein
MNPSPHREQPHLALARCMPHEREVGRGATELPRGKAASGPYRSASGEPPSTLSSSRCDEGSHSLEKSPRCDEGSHLVVYGCGGPQPPAGKQAARVPLRGNGLSHTSPERAFVGPAGGTCGPRENFARPCGAAPPPPRCGTGRCGWSESGRLCHGDGAHEAGERCRRGLMLPTLEVSRMRSKRRE